jgi:hypothetical protein
MLQAGFDAVLTRDVKSLIEALPPSRYRALYAYRDALDELARRNSSSEGDAPPRIRVRVTIDASSTFSDPRGIGLVIDRGQAVISNDGQDPSQTVTLAIDGKCATITSTPAASDGDVIESGPSGSFCLDRFPDGAGPLRDGIPGIDKFWVVLQQESGKFYVDPLASLGSWFSAVDVQRLSDEVQRELDSNPA